MYFKVTGLNNVSGLEVKKIEDLPEKLALTYEDSEGFSQGDYEIEVVWVQYKSNYMQHDVAIKLEVTDFIEHTTTTKTLYCDLDLSFLDKKFKKCFELL